MDDLLARHAVPSWRAAWHPVIRGLLVTSVAIALAHAAAFLAGPAATLQRVAIVLVVAGALYSAAKWGLGAGTSAGLLGAAYSMLFFAAFGTSAEMSTRLILGAAIGASVLGLSALTGHLRSRADAANRRAMALEREQSRALREKAAQLAEANADLSRANQALRAVNDSLEAFSYVVAHDLKEPVRAMAALLEDAERDAAADAVRDTVHHARLANERLATLLGGLLEVARASRIDPGDVGPIHPIEVLNAPDCVARYEDLRAARNARIEGSCLVGTPALLATHGHLSQILGNLVLNAIRHNDKTSPLVRVHVAPQDAESTMVRVSVEDDGPGLPPRLLQAADKTHTLAGGSFGLIIVRRAIEALGGSLRLGRSEQLGGAAVHFTLPAATPQRKTMAAHDTQGAPRSAARKQGTEGAIAGKG